jgi:hypothetical protein
MIDSELLQHSVPVLNELSGELLIPKPTVPKQDRGHYYVQRKYK